MQTATLKDRIMLKNDYLNFKNSINLYGGSFHVKQQPLPENQVHLTECRIELDPPEEIMRREERASFDETRAWRELVGLCRNWGFQFKEMGTEHQAAAVTRGSAK